MLLTIFAKCSILDVWQGSEYPSEKNVLIASLKAFEECFVESES